jgi:hypothetical protein
MILPPFSKDKVLPPGDYSLTLDELRSSHLVTGEGWQADGWEVGWRSYLVDSLEILVRQLWHVGIDRIFVDGSFVEAKAHPNDIDGYFECDYEYVESGQLKHDLNSLDPFRIWNWDHENRRYDRWSRRSQLPMWHQYHVELYPHSTGILTGLVDQLGYDLDFPTAFRTSRLGLLPKGIIQLVK